MKSKNAKSDQDKLKILLDWKKLYTGALIDALNPSKTVLEIGFGIGLAADRIDHFHPQSHVIMESDPQVLKEAHKWASKHPHTTIVESNWENAQNLGTFDAIFFNDYPLEEDMAIMNFLFSQDYQQISNEAKNILNSLEKQMSNLTTSFSDQDIEDFYQKTGQLNKKELPQFFQKLRENGNITQAQYEKAVKKYEISKISKEAKSLSKAPQKGEKRADRMLLCLEKCLKNNMQKGSRFTAFLNSQTSKYEDALFFDNIITNPDVEYNETIVPIKNYNALVILVKKR